MCSLQLEHWNQAFIHTLNNDVRVLPSREEPYDVWSILPIALKNNLK